MQQGTGAGDSVRPVLSTVLEPVPDASTVAVGIIEPRIKTDLSFRVLGRVIARPMNVGDFVEQGRLVAALDSATLELAVRSAMAELSRSQAQLKNAIAIERRKQVLTATDVASKATLDAAEQARAGAQASVARAQANLTKATEQLRYAQLKSDFAGVVTAVNAEVGQVVSPGQTVLTVAKPDIREAVVDIGPDFPVPLKLGLPFTVTLQLRPSIQVDGEIREIAPQADPITRTRRVRIALHEAPESIRLGSTVIAKLRYVAQPALLIPDSAVLTRDGKNFVWVVELPASKVTLRKVNVARDGVGFRIIDGLAAGARVVTAGIHSLHEGQQVRVEP